MSKKNFIIYSTLLLALGQTCQAASIYSFSGEINSVTGWSGTPGNTYTGIGIFTGAAVSFTTSLDANKNGTRTATDGTITYLPFYEHFGVITSQDQWHRYAALISSSIDISNSSVGGEKYNLLSDSTYFSLNSTPSYSGTILLGSQLRIYKTTPYGDTSAFVENWKVGDPLSFSLLFNNGSGVVGAQGQLTLASISTPLPAISDSTTIVPIPGTAWLLGSSLIGIAGTARRKRTNSTRTKAGVTN